MTDLFGRIAELERERTSFAIATVVARRSPVSSHLGDRALVFADGRMEGFVGGSCSRDIVRRQALGAIRRRQPVLLQIRPEAGPAGVCASDHDAGDSAAHLSSDEKNEPGGVSITERVLIPMSCASEGAVDVYIEPHVPLRRLIVVGFTPVAEALAGIACGLDYDVVRVVVDDELRDLGSTSGVRVLALNALRDFVQSLDDDARASLVAVVASQGHYDELALDVLHRFDVAFIGLLASRRRAATVFGVLAQQGVSSERLAMIRNPVGLDINARNPGEVAISILAEIIANAPAADARSNAAAAEATGRAGKTAVDPVCSMDVDVASALYRFEHAGQAFYFCCAGCRASFAADPRQYLVAVRP